MLRVFSTVIAGLVFFAGLVLAEEHRGYLKSVDKSKVTLTVEDKGKDKNLDIKTDAATRFLGGTAKVSAEDLARMIKDSDGKGVRAHVKTKGTGPAEVATEIRVASPRSKDEKK